MSDDLKLKQAVRDAEQRHEDAVAALEKAREQEAAVVSALGEAHVLGAATTSLRDRLRSIREERETLEASIPAHTRRVADAKIAVDAAASSSVREQLHAVTTERLKVAAECDLLMADLVAQLSRLTLLGQKAISCGKQLRVPNAELAGNGIAIAHWLAAHCYSVVPQGEWPASTSASYGGSLEDFEQESCGRVQ